MPTTLSSTELDTFYHDELGLTDEELAELDALKQAHFAYAGGKGNLAAVPEPGDGESYTRYRRWEADYRAQVRRLFGDARFSSRPSSFSQTFTNAASERLRYRR